MHFAFITVHYKKRESVCSPEIFYLAAATVVVAAVVGVAAVIATAAEQDQKDDDPAHITAAEVVVTHNDYLRNFIELCCSFQDIPEGKKGYS